MIYVLADDLTGATDTGVKFSKQGYHTSVSIVSLLKKERIKDFSSDVYVIDTETREVDMELSRERIRQVITDINPQEEDIVYKKIDSTLRGNIGAEIDELMELLGKDICLLAPSFPSNNRITVGGHQFVHGEPLGTTEYYYGDLDPGEASYVSSIIKQQTDLAIGRLDLKEVMKGQQFIRERIHALYREGKKIILADAINDINLQDILLSSVGFEGSILYSGSAGLAHHIPKIYQQRKVQQHLSTKAEGNRVLIVAGSRRRITTNQIDYLQRKMNIHTIDIPVADLFTQRKERLQEYYLRAREEMNEVDVIIRPHPWFNREEWIKQLLWEKKMERRDLEIAIHQFLGDLTGKLIASTSLRNLILTGGDIALGVCSASRISTLKILDELLPGIPLSSASSFGQELNIVTKAGGFGESDTLFKLVMALHKRA